MAPVEIIPIQGAMVLRARGSELLILEQYARELKKLENTKEFASFFTSTALVNRPARKLFAAWLRKDTTLWQRIYNTIHKEMEFDDSKTDTVSETNSEPAKEDTQSPTDNESSESHEEVKATKKKASKKKASSAKKTTKSSETGDKKKKTSKKKASKKKASKKVSAPE